MLSKAPSEREILMRKYFFNRFKNINTQNMRVRALNGLLVPPPSRLRPSLSLKPFCLAHVQKHLKLNNKLLFLQSEKGIIYRNDLLFYNHHFFAKTSVLKRQLFRLLNQPRYFELDNCFSNLYLCCSLCLAELLYLLEFFVSH